jgi:sugar (pentulose or hexulose) kinase
MQVMADAIGRPISAGKLKEASSRGAAVFAIEALALGVPAHVAAGRVYKPRATASRAYRKAEARQEALYRTLIVDRVLEKP